MKAISEATLRRNEQRTFAATPDRWLKRVAQASEKYSWEVVTFAAFKNHAIVLARTTYGYETFRVYQATEFLCEDDGFPALCNGSDAGYHATMIRWAVALSKYAAGEA